METLLLILVLLGILIALTMDTFRTNRRADDEDDWDAFPPRKNQSRKAS